MGAAGLLGGFRSARALSKEGLQLPVALPRLWVCSRAGRQQEVEEQGVVCRGTGQHA